MKYRKQTQHWRRYKSGRAILINKGIRYQKYLERKGPKLVELTPTGFEVLAKKVLDDDLKAGRITGTEYDQYLEQIRNRARLARIQGAYSSWPFKKKRYLSPEEWEKKVKFLDKYEFQQRTRRENIKNAPPLGRQSLSSLPTFVEATEDSQAFTEKELDKLIRKGLPIMKGAIKPVRTKPYRIILKRAIPKKPKFTFYVPHPQELAKEIEEREKRGEKIPPNFYDKLVEGLETFKYI